MSDDWELKYERLRAETIAQLAAKDAEIKELTEQQQHFGRLAREHYEQLQAQIDAQAAAIARLREALGNLKTRLWGEGFGYEHTIQKIIDAALTEEPK